MSKDIQGKDTTELIKDINGKWIIRSRFYK